MLKEYNNMYGTLIMRLTARNGDIIHQAQYKNRIVTSGRELVARLFTGEADGIPPTKVTHMAVGTDGTDPTDGDTALGAERAPRRAIAIDDITSFTDAEGVDRIRAKLRSIYEFGDANGTDPLQEAGIFTADTGGTLYSRVTFEPVTKTDAFKLTLLWDIVF